jgi:hypothetical protein
MKITPFSLPLKYLATLTLVLLPLLPATKASAQTVVSRARIGGYAEDITYVTSGPLKDQLVMINGYEFYGVNLAKKGTLTKICRFDHPEIDQFPNGLAYVESENLLVMNNDAHPNKLYFFDQSCTPKGTRTIQYLNSNYRPGHIEGLAYIPASSPVFADHLIMVVWDDFAAGQARLEVMRRDGVVVSEIVRPDWPAAFFEGGVGDVTFLAPNRLLVSAYHPDSLWIMDFSGNIISGPLATGDDGTGEGVVQLGDGRLVATSYPQNLLLFDKNLARQPENDRHDVIGLNLNVSRGIAWDSDANRLLVMHDTVFATPTPGIAAVSSTLDSATSLINLSALPLTRQTAYLPQEDLVAVLRFGAGPANRAILLFNLNGTFHSQISLSPTSLGQNFGEAVSLTYLPVTNEFVVGFNGVPGPDQVFERRRTRVISRTGALVRAIDFSSTGTAGIGGIEYFEDSVGAGRFLVLGGIGRVFITDLDGNSRNADGFLFGEFNLRVKLGLITRNDIAAITSGPLAGAFAIVDGSGGEVVIFRLGD